jgi:hypothetical protein
LFRAKFERRNNQFLRDAQPLVIGQLCRQLLDADLHVAAYDRRMAGISHALDVLADEAGRECGTLQKQLDELTEQVADEARKEAVGLSTERAD